MKMNRIIFFSLAAAILAGCETEESLLKNHVFIDAESFNNEVRVALDEGQTEVSRELNVSMASQEDNDVKIVFTKSPELLDTYRKAYYAPDVELLPDANCDFTGMETSIKAGDIVAEAVKFTFKDLDKLDLENKEYVLPVTLTSDGVDVLERAKTMYFKVKKASLVNSVADMNQNCAWPEWGDFKEVEAMKTFTMECLINCHAFNNESKIHTVMGIEDHFLIRIGDVQKSTNMLHVAAGYADVENGSYYRRSIPEVDDVQLQLKTDRWYHIAVTFDNGEVKLYLDGKERASGNIAVLQEIPNPDDPENPFKFGVPEGKFMIPHSDELDGKPRCFWLGYSYDHFAEGKMNRCLDGMMAEVRVWKKALTAEEINAPGHFYKIYPDKSTGKYSEDLVAYWKFNDEQGKTVKDYSQYGHDLEGFNSFIWYPVELPLNE